ncbi:MAG: hypothetical protein AAF570_21745 [Bacteroidota bacterium]
MGGGTFEIWSLEGKLLKRTPFGDTEVAGGWFGYPHGMYLIRVIATSGETRVYRFLKLGDVWD